MALIPALVAVSSVAVSVVLDGCLPPPADMSDEPALITGTVEVVARSPHIPTYPCVEQCHADRQPNATPRELTEFHTEKELVHGPRIPWCSFCHMIDDLDRFNLVDDTTVPFDEAFSLCGECHGDKLRDWNRGIHGMQTGSWNGVIQRRSCPACHNPHRPGEHSLVALPAPDQPRH